MLCHLRESGATVCIASRHPGRADGDNVKQIGADAHDEGSVEAAVACADGVVNAISLYVEHGSETFHSVHVEAAARIASVARRVGAKRLVHVSGIGADAASPSPYIRSRGEGEEAVQAAFPGAVIIRPAVLFARDDGLLTLVRSIAHTAGLRPALIRVPFAFWGALAGLAEFLPHPPLTRNQVELMQIDTTASNNLPGFRELGISPRSLEEELKSMLKQSK